MILGKEKRRKIVLVQEWVNNSKEIYKIYPKEHVQIIGNIIKTLSKDKFVIDIMSKNWLISEDNNLYYVDLILFNPKDQLSDQIKRLANELL